MVETIERPRLWRTPVAEDAPTDFVVARCEQCGLVMFPPDAERCRSCWSTSLSPSTVKGEGTLYSYTVVHRAFPGMATPFIVGMVETDEGIRFTARIAAEVGAVAIGDRLQAYARPVDTSSPALSYEFRSLMPKASPERRS